jgi:hypothetical protein
MTTSTIVGVGLVALAGLLTGSGSWPFKLMRQFRFEHWFFVGMIVGLWILPWAITLLFCPRPFEAYATVPRSALIVSNLFATGWGVANVLCGLCFVRIGVALTGAILTGLGVSVGVALPMIFKGTGKFQNAPDLGSPASRWILGGVAVMLVGVVVAAMAGFGRDRVLQKRQERSGQFLGGLIMTVIAGVLSCGMALAFVYSQGPVVEAMTKNGAGHIAANFAVWAAGLFGGALVNVLYPAYLLSRNKSWGVLTQSWKELALAALIGLNLTLAVSMMGLGMLMVGALGASVGFGIQQAMQIVGGQGLGFISGEWRGISGWPRRQMYAAIAIILVAAVLMALGSR